MLQWRYMLGNYRSARANVPSKPRRRDGDFSSNLDKFVFGRLLTNFTVETDHGRESVIFIISTDNGRIRRGTMIKITLKFMTTSSLYDLKIPNIYKLNSPVK